MSDDPLKKLSPRKRIYVKERAKGKTKKDAALIAGYKEETAKKAKSHIETPDVRRAFQELIRQKIPASKITTRLAEGLDAMETEFAKEKGMITDSRDVVAWSERREYLKLAAEYGGYFVPKQEVTVDDKHDGAGRLAAILASAASRVAGGDDAGRKV